MGKKGHKQPLKTLWGRRLLLVLACTTAIGFSATRIPSIRHGEATGSKSELADQSNQRQPSRSTSREEKIRTLLQQALPLTESLDNPETKGHAISSIAKAAGQLADADTSLE